MSAWVVRYRWHYLAPTGLPAAAQRGVNVAFISADSASASRKHETGTSRLIAALDGNAPGQCSSMPDVVSKRPEKNATQKCRNKMPSAAIVLFILVSLLCWCIVWLLPRGWEGTVWSTFSGISWMNEARCLDAASTGGDTEVASSVSLSWRRQWTLFLSPWLTVSFFFLWQRPQQDPDHTPPKTMHFARAWGQNIYVFINAIDRKTQ